jgi:hypothetical protein
MSDNSCATPSNHSGMVVFPQSDRIRRYLRPESYFSTQPLTGKPLSLPQTQMADDRLRIG